MEITPLSPGDRQVVQGYGKGGFRISDREWSGPVLVFPDRTLVWPVLRFADLDLTAFAPVRDAEPRVELLLIGTGSRMALLGGALRAELRSWGISIETMDTGAACRTYNLLMVEERRVAAALLPIG